MLEDKLKKCAVIGAGGKMGRGIALVLFKQMVFLDSFELFLIDTNPDSFVPLKNYLQSQLIKFLENKGERANMHAFVQKAMDQLHCSTDLRCAKDAALIFEAIVENIDVKVSVLSKLYSLNNQAFFFSNTSSIPIHYINEKAGLDKRIIGFHFYNPPAVQKLLEIIPPEGVDRELYSLAHDLAERLNKIVVESKDTAGFIGNGYFLREILFACKQVEDLPLKTHSAIELVNRVTKDYLVRPMGIFQLVDYVGIDVCGNVAKIMQRFLGISVETTLIREMLQEKKWGGQNPDGSQKDGFFSYDGDQITGVYDLKAKVYQPCTVKTPSGFPVWKDLLQDPQKNEKLKRHFQSISQDKSKEASLAAGFLQNLEKVADGLVKDGVAKSLDDVTRVLTYGFYHLYGPFQF